MTTTLIRERATEIHSVGFIDHAKDSEMPRWEGALDRLISAVTRIFHRDGRHVDRDEDRRDL